MSSLTSGRWKGICRRYQEMMMMMMMLIDDDDGDSDNDHDGDGQVHDQSSRISSVILELR